MRPLTELTFWKASELRLFLLYAGIVLLKEKNVLSKNQYKHFLKYAVAMRMLLFPSNSDECLALVNKLLD